MTPLIELKNPLESLAPVPKTQSSSLHGRYRYPLGGSPVSASGDIVREGIFIERVASEAFFEPARREDGTESIATADPGDDDSSPKSGTRE